MRLPINHPCLSKLLIPLIKWQKRLNQTLNLFSVVSNIPKLRRHHSKIFQTCTLEAESEIIQFDYIKVTPDFVTLGSEVTIEAEGTLSDNIEYGTYALVVVKVGRVVIFKQEYDVCEELESRENELRCPVEEGKVVVGVLHSLVLD